MHTRMSHATRNEHVHSDLDAMAIHLITSAAKILLMLGTAVLVGEVATGQGRKLLKTNRVRQVVNEDNEPAD